jgi:ArsR family transcriptional regulator
MFALIDAWSDGRLARSSRRTRLERNDSRRAREAQPLFRGHAEVWDQIRSLHVAESEVERAIDERWATAARPLVDVGTGTGG